MKLVIMTTCFPAGPGAVAQEKTFKLTGTLKGDYKGYIYPMYPSADQKTITQSGESWLETGGTAQIKPPLNFFKKSGIK